MLLRHGRGLARSRLRSTRFRIEWGAAIAAELRGSRILRAALGTLGGERASTLAAESGAGRIFGAAFEQRICRVRARYGLTTSPRWFLYMRSRQANTSANVGSSPSLSR